MAGQPVFKGKRVPIESLFDYLEGGVSLDEFLDEFDTVSKDQEIVIMEIASKLLSSKNIIELYAAVFDENIPNKLKTDFPGHKTFIIKQRGWNGLKNGILLQNL